MALSTIYTAAQKIGTQISAVGTAPEVVSIVPSGYGNNQPSGASVYWVNIEQISESIQAEVNNSYLQYFTLGIWVWVSSPELLDSVSSRIAGYTGLIRDKLVYNTLDGWAREGISDKEMSVIKYVKGPVPSTVRYGAMFTVTVCKQSTL